MKKTTSCWIRLLALLLLPILFNNSAFAQCSSVIKSLTAGSVNVDQLALNVTASSADSVEFTYFLTSEGAASAKSIMLKLNPGHQGGPASTSLPIRDIPAGGSVSAKARIKCASGSFGDYFPSSGYSVFSTISPAANCPAPKSFAFTTAPGTYPVVAEWTFDEADVNKVENITSLSADYKIGSDYTYNDNINEEFFSPYALRNPTDDTPYGTQFYIFRIQSTCGTNKSAWFGNKEIPIDSILLDFPACDNPVSLTISDTTSQSITINYHLSKSNNSLLEYKKAGDANFTVDTISGAHLKNVGEKTLNFLPSSTEYIVRTRTLCRNGNSSTYMPSADGLKVTTYPSTCNLSAPEMTIVSPLKKYPIVAELSEVADAAKYKVATKTSLKGDFTSKILENTRTFEAISQNSGQEGLWVVAQAMCEDETGGTWSEAYVVDLFAACDMPEFVKTGYNLAQGWIYGTAPGVDSTSMIALKFKAGKIYDGDDFDLQYSLYEDFSDATTMKLIANVSNTDGVSEYIDTLKGLQENELYYFTMRKNCSEELGDSSYWSHTKSGREFSFSTKTNENTACKTPTNLRLISSRGASPTIIKVDKIPGVGGFEFVSSSVRDDIDLTSPISATKLTDSSFQIEELSEGNHFIKVRSTCGANGVSGWSRSFEIFIGCPRIINIEKISDDGETPIIVKWDQEGLAEEYEYLFTIGDDEHATVPQSNGTVDTLVLETLGLSNTFNLKVRAICAEGVVGNWSEDFSFTIACEAVSIDVENITNTSVDFKFATEGNYEIRFAENDSLENVAEADYIKVNNGDEHKFSELSEGVRYYYQVRQVCPFTADPATTTTSAWSAKKSFHTACNEVTATIENIAPTAADVKFVASGDYQIRYADNENLAAVDPINVTNADKHSLSGLTETTKYYYQVRTVCNLADNIFSEWSTTADFTTKEPVSIAKGSTLKVRLYPNPSNGQFTVEVPATAKMEIFSLTGATVMNKMINGTEEVTLNSKGFYLVRLTDNEGKSAVVRVVVR